MSDLTPTTDIEMSDLTPDIPICYICCQVTDIHGDSELVRPCSNQLCQARTHQGCLQTQYGTCKKSCGFCNNKIVAKRVNKFDVGKCVEEYLKIVYTLLITLGGGTLTVLFALGYSLTEWSINDGFGPIGAMVLVLPQVLGIWQFPLCRCGWNCFNKEQKNGQYITMFISWIVSNLVVLVAKGIGYGVLISHYGIYEFFTWRATVAGYVVYLIIIGCILGLCILYWLGTFLYECSIRKYSEDEIILGEVITE